MIGIITLHAYWRHKGTNPIDNTVVVVEVDKKLVEMSLTMKCKST